MARRGSVHSAGVAKIAAFRASPLTWHRKLAVLCQVHCTQRPDSLQHVLVCCNESHRSGLFQCRWDGLLWRRSRGRRHGRRLAAGADVLYTVALASTTSQCAPLSVLCTDSCVSVVWHLVWVRVLVSKVGPLFAGLLLPLRAPQAIAPVDH